MSPEQLLSSLVAFRSIAGAPNGTIVDYVRDFLSTQGVASAVVSGPEGQQ